MKTIGANIVLEGEASYREALRTIAGQQRELASEMQLTSVQFDGQQNSIEALEKKYGILGDQIEKQREKIDVYVAALDSSEGRQQAAADAVDKYEKELKEAREQLDAMKSDSSVAEEALAAQEQEVGRLSNAYKEAGEELQNADRDVTYWQTSLNKANAELAGMESVLEKTGGYINEAKEASDRHAKSIDEYGDEVKEATESTSIFGETLKSSLTSEAIVGAIRGITNAVKGIASSAIETGSSFEASMSQVAATMGMTADEIEGGSEAYALLSDAAKKCGEETKYSASEAAEALNYLALAGYDAAKSAETLPKVLNLAAAGGLDLATASDMVTDAMAALNMETAQLDKYIDEMATTAQKSNTSVAQLGEATLTVAGAATSAGMDLETMNAELGVLANNGIKGAEGGTHLRNVILSLASPTTEATEALKELGVRTSDSNGNIRDMNAVLYDLNQSLDGMGTAERTQMISRIFNKTDISAVNALLKGTTGEFDLLKRNIELSAGAAQNMADTMNNNLKGKVTILQSALEGLGISVYEVFDDDLKRGVDAATDAVGRLNDSIRDGDMGASLNKFSEAIGDVMEKGIETAMDVLPKLIDGLALVLSNLDTIIPVVEGVATGFLTFKAATAATDVLNGAIAALQPALAAAAEGQGLLNAVQAVSPMGAVAAAAGVLTTALGVLFEKTGNYTPAVHELTREEQALVDSMQKASGAVDAHRSAFSQSVDSMAANRTQATELIAKLRELEPAAKEDAASMSEMQRTVDTLNAIMPDLGLSINSVTGELNMGIDAAEEYTDALMRQIEQEAYSERLTEIIRDKVDIQNELIEREEAYNEALERNNAAFEERNRAREAYNEALQAYAEGTRLVTDTELLGLQQAAEAAQENAAAVAMETAAVRGEYGGLQTQLEALDGEYERYRDLLSDTAPQAAATDANDAMADSFVNWRGYAVPAIGDVESQLAELEEKYTEARDAAEESLRSQMGLFQEFKTESQSIASMTDNMKTQTDAMTEYGDNLQKALDLDIDPGIIAGIEEMGMQGAGYLQALVDAAEEGGDSIAEFIDAWEANQKAFDDLAETMAEFEVGYSETMGRIVEDGGAAHEEMTDGQEQFSESYVQSWATMGEDAAQAIADAEPTIVENVTLAASSAIATINSEFGIGEDGNSAQGRAAGESFGRSIADGIEAMEDDIVSAVDRVGQAAKDRAAEWARRIDEALGENL